MRILIAQSSKYESFSKWSGRIFPPLFTFYGRKLTRKQMSRRKLEMFFGWNLSFSSGCHELLWLSLFCKTNVMIFTPSTPKSPRRRAICKCCSGLVHCLCVAPEKIREQREAIFSIMATLWVKIGSLISHLNLTGLWRYLNFSLLNILRKPVPHLKSWLRALSGFQSKDQAQKWWNRRQEFIEGGNQIWKWLCKHGSLKNWRHFRKHCWAPTRRGWKHTQILTRD